MMKNFLLASTSTVHNGVYLDYLLDEIATLYKGVREVIFVPYARPGGLSHEEYSAKVHGAFQQMNIAVRGVHQYDEPRMALADAEGIFTGGGNTFLLVAQLYKHNLMDVLAQKTKGGTPYLGTSAGSNIAGLTMQTTNDMPIIYPPSFQTMGLIPFNLNPHYLDPDMGSNHMGETRETRIKEFHAVNSVPVLGLREGSWLRAIDGKITLEGKLKARLFEKDKSPVELESGIDLTDLK